MENLPDDYYSNVGKTELYNFKVVESFPPNSPFAKLMGSPGVQNTPSLARGNLNNSIIQVMNGNLAHACDFKFIFNVNIDLFTGLTNPVTAIQNAIRSAQLKATTQLTNLIKDAAQNFRKAIEAIVNIIGLDPSGQISFYFSLGKDIIREVNEAIEFVAAKVEAVLEWVFFAQQIQQLINWITSLPERFKNLILTCLNSFTNSIKAIADNIQSLPSQVQNLTRTQIQGIANQFASAAQATATAAQEGFNTNNANLPNAVIQAITSPDTANLDDLGNTDYPAVPESVAEQTSKAQSP
jgi:phage-related protein